MKRLATAVLAALALPVAGRDYVVEVAAGPPNQSGYLQTPAGGIPGTASAKRPTLAEIDLHRGRYRWIGAGVDFGRKANANPTAARSRLRLWARYTTTGDEATSSIAEAFTIRGGVFEAGDSVRSRVSFDGLTLALTAAFDLGSRVSVEVGPEIGWTAFDFTMTGERHRSDRSYHVTTFGLAGAISKQFGNDWHVGARLAAAPAIEGTGSRYRVDIRVGRDLSKMLGVAVGASVEAFRYDDGHKQALPNRINVTRRVVPTLRARLRL